MTNTLAEYQHQETHRLAELNALAGSLAAQLRTGINPQRDAFEIPMTLALLLEQLSGADKRSLDSFLLVETLGYWTGRKVHALLPDCLALHAELLSRGATEATPYDFGYADRYAFALAEHVGQINASLRALLERIAPGESAAPEQTAQVWQVRTRVFVLQAQSYRYLVLLQQRFGHWSMHLRQVHAAGATRSCPSLEMLLDGTLEVGEEGAGIGFRYGDARDAGYLASVCDSFGAPCVDGALKGNFALLSVVLHDLASAVDTLVRPENQAI